MTKRVCRRNTIKILGANKINGEISYQIAGIQTATQDSVAAIKEISGTTSRISEISTTIAVAVEEQGAATHRPTACDLVRSPSLELISRPEFQLASETM